MPFFNRKQSLVESVESVLSQRFDGGMELLLVDDGSLDAGLRVALDLAADSPDVVRILRHAGGRNRGASASRNLALRHARGDLLTFLDADDVWLPNALQTQVDTMRRFPDAAMVFGTAERWCDHNAPFDEEAARTAWWGQNFIPSPLPVGEAFGMLPKGALVGWFLRDESMVPCLCSVMLRTAAARGVGGFEEQFRGLYDDQAFHAKVAMRYPVAAHPHCLARYRQHENSCCAEGRRDQAVQRAAREQFLHWLGGYRTRAAMEDVPASAQV